MYTNYYNAIFNSLEDGVMITDQNLNILYLNKKGEQILGWRQDELYGKCVSPTLVPETESLTTIPYNQIIKKIYVRRDGSSIPVEISITPIFNLDSIENFTITFKDVSEKQFHISLLKGQTRILEDVLSEKPLPDIMTGIIQEFEQYLDSGFCSVKLLEKETQTLHLLAAPSLPEGFRKFIQKIKIGPNIGSSGTAAYRKELVIVSDIDNSPLWKDFKGIAAKYHIQACWSRPIFGSEGQEILGTFGIFYPVKRTPKPYIIELLETYANMAGIAIERYLCNQELQESRKQYRLITQNMTELICILNRQGENEYTSPSHLNTIGFMPKTLKDFNALVHPNDIDYLEAVMQEVWETAEASKCQFQIRNTHGKWAYLETNITPLMDENAEDFKILCISRLITEQKEYENKLKQMAFFDTLTNLPNRHYFIEQLKLEIQNARAKSSQLALIYLDCDDFKQINDTIGHEAEDLFLQEFANRIQQLQLGGMLARMGGDEFILMLQNSHNADTIALIAENILSTLQKPWLIYNKEFILSVSMGISQFPRDGTTATTLIKQADSAMYFAKKHGKNQFQFYNKELHNRIYNQTKLKKDLHFAINNNELVVFYQPIVNVKTKVIEGAEALLRWNHPQYGLIPPTEFITLAEESGLITHIGDWVLSESCKQLKKWHETGYTNMKISVNLSPIQLEQYHYEEKLLKTIQELDIKPEFISLEITESIIIEDRKNTRKVLEQLREKQITISFDDFGTGYSSLAYLKDFPVDKIKIDRAFVKDLTLSNHDSVIVDTIIKICSSLNLSTIAEGVETAQHALKLQELGCVVQQGYYFSKPCSPEELEAKFPIIEKMLIELNKDLRTIG